jgi:hypothetical protein
MMDNMKRIFRLIRVSVNAVANAVYGNQILSPLPLSKALIRKGQRLFYSRAGLTSYVMLQIAIAPEASNIHLRNL